MNNFAVKRCSVRFLVTMIIVIMVPGCAALSGQKASPMDLPEPLRGKRTLAVEDKAGDDKQDDIERVADRFVTTPRVGPLVSASVGMAAESQVMLPDEAGPLEISVQDMSLPAFINEVYGNLLRLDFYISESVSKLEDLVTFRITEPESPQILFSAANDVLESYGVSSRLVGDVLQFEVASVASGAEPPLIVSGRSMPNVPVTHRPIFQIVRLKSVRVSDVAVWVKAALEGQGLQVLEDHAHSTVILKGKPDVVRQAIEAISYFDQPSMRGRNSIKVNPRFWVAEDLARELQRVLRSEGYDVGTNDSATGTILLPVKHTNTVLVFASDETLLPHIRAWVETLDTPPKNRSEKGFFSYQVRNTAADGLAEVLENFTEALVENTAGSPAAGKTTGLPGDSKIVVDAARNALVFYGQADIWMQMLPMIEEMDRADRMALIEVTIAEIQLTDQNQFGIEWLAKGAGINGEDGILSTQGGLGLEPNGLSYVLNSAGQTRAVLSAFAANNRVNVISTPRLMTRSGFPASINVGDEVPLIASQGQSNIQEGGDSAILQQVQYQKTGVTLSIAPVIFSDNKISLEINQVVSDALANETSSINSPVIQNREINTSVTLEDGGSVLIAGLIRETKTRGANKVPGLGDIPLLGRAFRSDSETVIKTELVILVVPYIINEHSEAEDISTRYRKELGW